MFGSEKKNGPRAPASVDTLIGAGTTIKGDVTFQGGLHIDGTVVGAIVAEPGADAMLMLSDKGRVQGEIRAPHVVINGTMQGDIVATERVELASQARVTGNIFYKVLEMAAGAQVNGQIAREEEPKKSADNVEPLQKVKAVS